jgi:hypothetical protein
MPNSRITVTLPSKVVRAIDREELNRSQLRQSLTHPHPESLEMAEVGLATWTEGLLDDASDLIAPDAGERVQWTGSWSS